MMAQRDPWVNMLRTTRGRIRRGCRWRGHRAGAAVRCGDPGWVARHRSGFRPSHRPQYPTAAAGGIPSRPGARPRGRFLVRRGPHRAARRAGLGTLPADRGARRFRRGRATSSPRQIAEVRDRRHATTSTTAAPRSPASTNTRTSTNHHCRTVIRRPRSSDTPPGSRRCATAPTPTSRRPGRGRKCCCCRSVRSPSTTSAQRSPPTCSPPAASRRSTRAPSRPRAWPTPYRRQAPRMSWCCAGPTPGTEPKRRVWWRPRARPGCRAVLLAGPEKAVAERRSQARRLPDRQDRRGRRPVGPAHPIGGTDEMTAEHHKNRQLRRRPAAQRARRRARHGGRRSARTSRPPPTRTGTRPTNSTGRRRKASTSSRSTSLPTGTPRSTAGYPLDTFPGEPPYRARPVPDDVRQPAVDHPAVRRVLHRRGIQRLLPPQPRSRAEGAVGGVRPGHPPRLRLRPSPRRG